MQETVLIGVTRVQILSNLDKNVISRACVISVFCLPLSHLAWLSALEKWGSGAGVGNSGVSNACHSNFKLGAGLRVNANGKFGNWGSGILLEELMRYYDEDISFSMTASSLASMSNTCASVSKHKMSFMLQKKEIHEQWIVIFAHEFLCLTAACLFRPRRGASFYFSTLFAKIQENVKNIVMWIHHCLFKKNIARAT